MAGTGSGRLARAVLFLASLPLGGALAHAQGKLDKVGEAVHGDDDDDESEHSVDDDLSDELFESALDAADEDDVSFFDVLLAPFSFPRLALRDEGENARYSLYPYRDGGGYFLRPEDRGPEREWSFRPRAEIGTDFEDLERYGLAFQLEHAARVGLDVTWNRWREDLDGGGHDELDLGDANVTYRFAQGDTAAFRAGLGINYLNDDIDEETGFNSTYGIDLLMGKPVTGAFEGDLGTLGDATLWHVRAELGFVIERFGLYASFDRWDIDGVQLDSYALGMRGWF